MRPEKTDIVIVGAGGAGISAALSAAESGLQILVLEKTEWPGGSTRMSGGGIAATGTSFQKEAGITDNKDSWLELWKKDRQRLTLMAPTQTMHLLINLWIKQSTQPNG
jgi:Succinate dehydrogenase/fumarate reductase, flavoprotein subunit